VDWARIKAALIRAFWTFVFPMIGVLVLWLTDVVNLQSIGVTDAVLASLIAAVLYGVKKLVWPDTTF
jgi:hypothetical protein